MIFNSVGSYYHSMDREYNEPSPKPPAEQLGPDEPMPGVGVGDIGMSVPMGIAAQNVQGVASHIRMGAQHLDIQFTGVSRSQKQSQTPGIYGEEQRQALRELRKANDVKFTTHATFGIMGASGFTGDNPYNAWFTKEQRKIATEEMQRAVDFAKDVAGGGSVTIHVGEVERPISESPWNRTKDGRYLFKHFDEEPEHARLRVVDDRTGQVMQQVRKNQRISRPKWLKADHDHEGEDSRGNKVMIKKGDYINYLDQKIPDDITYHAQYGRVPTYDFETGRFVTEYYDWNDIVKETNGRNEWKRKMLGRELTFDEEFAPEEVYLRSTLETNEAHSRGWSLQYGERVDKEILAIKKLRESLEFYKDLEKKIPKEEVWKVMKDDTSLFNYTGQDHLVPMERKMPTDLLKDRIKQTQKSLEFARQASVSQQMQAEDSAETQRHVVSATKYGRRESVKSYAESAIHAIDASRDSEKPVYLSMEHIFPERFGGHPEELRQLVYDTREEVVARLSDKRIKDPANKKDKFGNIVMVDNPYFRGITEKEARKLAENSVKVTLDTGHLNTWRKYWQGNPQKSWEENNEGFKKWYLQQVEMLSRENLIGNVHLSDNFGYNDEHLAIGQGNAPVKEAVAILKKYGYDETMLVEPGGDATTNLSAFHGLMTSWRHFGSPIYGMGFGGGGQGGWSDIQYGYFGRARPPYYVFGSYSPSNEWQLWSQVPLE
ncbi:TIM barrel protein [Nanoarchaeota archaeon]